MPVVQNHPPFLPVSPVDHAATLTEKIRALRDGAISAGNLALVSTCEIALRPAGELDVLAPTASGAPWRDDLAVLAARAECADAILDATIRAEADAYLAASQPGAPQETLVAEAVAVASTRSALAAHDAALGEYERAAAPAGDRSARR